MKSRFRKRPGIKLLEILVLVAVLLAITAALLPVLLRREEDNHHITCSSNQRQIAVAMQMYAQDHDGLLPPVASVWTLLNRGYIDKGVLLDPFFSKRRDKPQNSYGYNRRVSGIYLDDKEIDPKTTLLCADCKTDAPYPNLLLTDRDIDPRHDGAFFAAYADGHVSTVAKVTPDVLEVKKVKSTLRKGQR